MNIIAVDIGNTNIRIGFFLEDNEEFVKKIAGGDTATLREILQTALKDVPIAKASKDKKRDCVIAVSSVRPEWTENVRKIAAELGEKIMLVGEDIPLIMEMQVDQPDKVGTDRVVAAAAASEVAQDAVVVADFGTAVTIDVVDENGVFLGGVIFPGFEMSALALKEKTAKLPLVQIRKPELPYGTNTADAINCGLYYAAIGALEEIVRRYAEKLGRWPHTVITGGGAELIKDDCPFADDFVPNLVLKGIVLMYKKYLETK